MTQRSHVNPEYVSFINSEEWRKIKKALFAVRRKICEECGAVDVIHVHHLTYKRFGGKERQEDLKVLCEPCHMALHERKCPIPKIQRQTQPYYRKLAIQYLGIKKSGGKGWGSLAKLVANRLGDSQSFNGRDHAKRYVKKTLSTIKEERQTNAITTGPF